MNIVKTEAFVLKSFRYGETSKIVTLLTKDHGKVSAIIKGARNYKSKLCGVLESMNYINAVIYIKENRDLQLVSSAEYIKSFKAISNNFDKIILSYRIIEMINKSVIENEINKATFALLLNTYEILEISEKNFHLNLIYFQIKLLQILGICPDFTNTGSAETFIASNEFNLNINQIRTLKKILEMNFAIESDSSFNEEEIKVLSDIFEKYILNHTQGSKYYLSKKIYHELNQFDQFDQFSVSIHSGK